MTLERLMELARAKWQFDAITYPELKDAPPETILDFAIRHVVLHQMKSLGKIAARCESVNHGDNTQLPKELEELAVKMFVNAIRLADLIGLTPESLDTIIEDWASSGVRYIQHNEPRTGEPLFRPVRE